MPEKLILFIIPLLWAVPSIITVNIYWTYLEKKRHPYRLARLAAMTEKEFILYESRDSRGLQRVIGILDKSIQTFDVEGQFWLSLDRMLRLMGNPMNGKESFARGLLEGLLGAIPLLSVPIFTGQWVWILLYPIFSVAILLQALRKVQKDYKKWQQRLVRDIPGVIDRLRISFAGGRDYLSVLSQAGQGSGPAMQLALEHLVNDIHTVGSAEALRLFSGSFDLPMMGKLAAAISLAIESGYEAAESYFANIEEDILTLRQEAVEALTKAKPEKVYQLYILMFILALAALGLKGWEIFQVMSILFI